MPPPAASGADLPAAAPGFASSSCLEQPRVRVPIMAVRARSTNRGFNDDFIAVFSMIYEMGRSVRET